MKKIFLSLLTCLLALGVNGQTINSVSPNSAQNGTWTLPVTISGTGTSFSNATSTVVRIKQGNQQLEVLNVNSVSAEQVNIDLRVSNLKPTGNYSVEVYDANLGLINMSNGFTVSVNSDTPTLLSTSPDAGAINQVLPVTIKLQNTHFAQATDNTIYLTQGTQTIMPIPGTMVVLNDNYIKASFDLSNPLISIGNILNSHCGNSHDGYFSDNLAIDITQITSISGVVIYGGVYNGVIELYQKHENIYSYSLVATVNVDGSNAYVFDGVADAEYLVRSVPINMQDVVATYFPNSIDWVAADLIDSHPTFSINKDISPVTTLSLNGVATVNGSIGYGPNGYTKASFTLAEGVEVFLKNTITNTYAQEITDINGMYSFANVPVGNYQIVINLPGYHQISTYDFVVNDFDTDFGGLDFLIDNGDIFKSAYLGTSSKELKELTVYPNPTNNLVVVSTPSLLTSFRVSIYNQLGQKVMSENVINNSTQNYTANLSNLENGIYVINIQNDSEMYQVKVIKR